MHGPWIGADFMGKACRRFSLQMFLDTLDLSREGATSMDEMRESIGLLPLEA